MPTDDILLVQPQQSIHANGQSFNRLNLMHNTYIQVHTERRISDIRYLRLACTGAYPTTERRTRNLRNFSYSIHDN